MKNALLISALCCALGLPAQMEFKPSARSWETGILFGGANYSGDLAEKSIQLSETHVAYGLFLRHFLFKKVALKMHGYAGTLSGDDAHAKDPELRERHFRFATNFFELGLTGEWHFLKKETTNKLGEPVFSISPYGFLGLAFTFADTETSYYGLPENQDKFLLVPLPEPGLRKQFLLAPIGLGVRANLNERVFIGVEAGVRPLFSDGLDGVRQNGDPDKNDWYYMGGATLAFRLDSPAKH